MNPSQTEKVAKRVRFNDVVKCRITFEQGRIVDELINLSSDENERIVNSLYFVSLKSESAKCLSCFKF